MTASIPHAYSGEAILKGVTYSRGGGHCIRLEVEPEGWEALKAMDGAHFMAVLVPVANDGSPDRDAVAKAEQPSWKPVSRAQMAGILCNDPRFQRFVADSFFTLIHGAEDAADCIRRELKVASRAEFDSDEDAGERWDNFRAEYEAWLRT